jgi:hypothetical protein
MPATALYAFGHGLSYTDFALSDLHCDAQVDTAGVPTIGVTVTSSGDVAGAPWFSSISASTPAE